MNKKILFGISISLLIAVATYYYIYQGHRNINTETAAYVINIAQLEAEFTANDSIASSKYQDQTIQLTAQITAVDTENKAVILDNKLLALFDDNLTKDIISGKTLKFKGRFLGYDELLEEFKMDQSSIIR